MQTNIIQIALDIAELIVKIHDELLLGIL